MSSSSTITATSNLGSKTFHSHRLYHNSVDFEALSLSDKMKKYNFIQKNSCFLGSPNIGNKISNNNKNKNNNIKFIARTDTLQSYNKYLKHVNILPRTKNPKNKKSSNHKNINLNSTNISNNTFVADHPIIKPDIKIKKVKFTTVQIINVESYKKYNKINTNFNRKLINDSEKGCSLF